MAIKTRTLGRTQADVTILGYGAMELRGGPRGPEIGDDAAGRLLNGAARGAPSEEKNWRIGPLSQPAGLGRRNWAASGIEDLLAGRGMSRMEFVLRFTLSHPDLSTTIVGTASLDHLTGNIAIAEKGPLPADLYAAAKPRLTPADE